jgi:hypothetical protein
MFAVRDNRTGKFLRNFSGSLNHAEMYCAFDLEDKLGRKPTRDELHAAMWCMDTPEGSKLYKTESGIKTSFYSYCFRRIDGNRKRIPLAEALPWLQVVKVKIIYACEE